MVLWLCESWALTEDLMRKLRVFHTLCCRPILGITMWEVAMYSVTNENMLRYELQADKNTRGETLLKDSHPRFVNPLLEKSPSI